MEKLVFCIKDSIAQNFSCFNCFGVIDDEVQNEVINK